MVLNGVYLEEDDDINSEMYISKLVDKVYS